MSATNAKTNYLMVKQFNQVFGHAAPVEPQHDIFTNSSNIVKLRNSLILEEINELKEAIEQEDVIEIIDALSDIQYVAYGLLVVYGIDGDKEFTNYLSNKYELLDCKRSDDLETKSNFCQTSDFIKSLLFGNSFNVTPKSFLDNYTNPSFNQIFKNYIESLVEAYNTLECETKICNFTNTINSTLEIIYLTYVIGTLMGVDLDKSIRMVHESNMSKICSSEDEAQKTVKWYKDNETRYDSPYYRKSEFLEGYVVFNESTGKILKNVNYRAVDLSGFLQ